MKLPSTHLTPRYVQHRVAAAWYRWRNPQAPWLTARGIEFLQSWLRPSDRGVEWGAGRSTLWFGGRVQHLLSIEHSREWHLKIGEQVKQRGLPVELRWAPAERPEAETMYAEELVLGGVIPAAYARQVDDLPDRSLDFALVDGMWRDLCFEIGMRKLRSGGLLILDNANWSLPSSTRAPKSVPLTGEPPTALFRQCWSTVKEWRRYWTSDGVTDTAFFVKP
jgi:hypothetical protein